MALNPLKNEAVYAPDSDHNEQVKSRALKARLDTELANVRVRAVAICLAVGLLVVAIELFRVPVISNALDAQELAVHDRFFSLSNRLDSRSVSLADEIVLVCADADSARRLGFADNTSFPRHLYARLLEELQSAGVSVIGLDVPLDEAGTEKRGSGVALDKRASSDGDSALVRSLSKLKNIVLSSNVDPEARSRSSIYRLPAARFIEALGVDSGSVGNAFIFPDSDGLTRHMTLAFNEFSPSAFWYKSFPLRIAEKELDAKALQEQPGRLFLRKHVYPERIRLNFLGPPQTFKMVPLWRALDWKTHMAHNGLFLQKSAVDKFGAPDDAAAANPFLNKIVLVGLVDNAAENIPAPQGAANYDLQPAPSFATPVSSPNLPMSALELQATAISNLLHDRFLDESEPWKSALLCLLLALTLGRVLAALHARPWLCLFVVIGIAMLWLGLAFLIFAYLHVLVPVVVPVVAVGIPCWALVILDSESFARRERRRRTRVFRSLAAKPLAQEIERKLLAELGLEGKRLTVTVLTCQMRDFIGAREEESPETVMERLNACLSVMMDCIGEHYGLVERLWNCGVIGIWGAPIGMSEEKQAKLAADCALAIRKRLFHLHDNKELYTGLNFNFTCGISTGDSICGTINAIARDTNLTQYGALGPAVDLAVELESLNPAYGTTFMLSAITAALVSRVFEVREIDRVKLLHRDSEQSVYELLPWEGSLPGALEEAMALFRQGRVAFEEGRIQEAETLFSTSLRMVPHDKPTLIMLDRCRELINKSSGGPEFVQKLTLKERLSEGRD